MGTIGWLDLVFFQYLPKVKDGCERGRRWLPTTVPGLQAQVWMVAHRRGWSFVPTNYHPPASFPESRRLAHARLEPLLELSRQGRGSGPLARDSSKRSCSERERGEDHHPSLDLGCHASVGGLPVEVDVLFH